MDVNKGLRTASTAISLDVVEGNPPNVRVDLASIKTVADDRVRLEGFYEISAPEPTKVEWSCTQQSGAVVEINCFCA